MGFFHFIFPFEWFWFHRSFVPIYFPPEVQLPVLKEEWRIRTFCPERASGWNSDISFDSHGNRHTKQGWDNIPCSPEYWAPNFKGSAILHLFSNCGYGNLLEISWKNYLCISVFKRCEGKKTQIANMIKGAGNSISSKERIWTCNRREKDFEIKGKGWFLGTHSEWDRWKGDMRHKSQVVKTSYLLH